MTLTIEKFLSLGYTQHKPTSFDNYDILLQKRVDDEHGIKYYINVHVYDRINWISFPKELPRYGFEPEVQFREDERVPTVNMTYLCALDTTIEDIEKFYEGAWVFMDKPYYERNYD